MLCLLRTQERADGTKKRSYFVRPYEIRSGPHPLANHILIALHDIDHATLPLLLTVTFQASDVLLIGAFLVREMTEFHRLHLAGQVLLFDSLYLVPTAF